MKMETDCICEANCSQFQANSDHLAVRWDHGIKLLNFHLIVVLFSHVLGTMVGF